MAGWLTLYQFGLLAQVWDPVFGSHASRAVLDLTAPVPDALAGVIAYGTEIALLLLASLPDRRVRAWTTLGLGAMLTAGVVVSVALIAVQALVVGAWCTLCLCSAALSLALFTAGFREVRRAREYLRHDMTAAA